MAGMVYKEGIFQLEDITFFRNYKVITSGLEKRSCEDTFENLLTII